MSALNRIRPLWLRSLIYCALSLVATAVGLLLIFAMATILKSHSPGIGAWEEQHRLLLIVSLILFVLLAFIWGVYRTRGGKGTATISWKAAKAVHLGHYEEALAALDLALSLYPRDAANWLNKGVALHRLKRDDEALEYLDQALKLNPNYALAWFNKSTALFKLNRYDEALAANEQGLRIDPSVADAWYNQGNCLSRANRLDEALDANDIALSLKPHDVDYWVGRGTILVRLKHYDEALAVTERGLKIDSMNPLAWNNKASILCERLNRYTDALAVCDEALAHGISIAGIWAIKGDALHALGHDEEARGAYETVLTFPTDDFLSWASTGTALAALGRCDEALVAFESALTFYINSANVWRKKANVLRTLGREDEAREAEQQADELER